MLADLVEHPTTYSDLRNGDRIKDRSGKIWIVVDPAETDGQVSLKLATPQAPKMAQHSLTRPAEDAVTAMRPPDYEPADHEATVAQRERQMDFATASFMGLMDTPLNQKHLVTELEGTVLAVETPEHEHERKSAEATKVPFRAPLFDDMTPLEQYSHMFLVHGQYSADLSQRDLIEAHTRSHDNDAPFTPHSHEEQV